MADMLEPMLAKLADPDISLTGSWISEPKYDGQRILAHRKGDTIRLLSRRHLQVAKKFPEIVEALKSNINDDNWILDGELTVPGGFSNLIHRNVEDEFRINLLARKIPATYHLFDILRLDGEDLVKKTLKERKKILLNTVHQDERISIIPFRVVEGNKVKDHFNQYINQGFEGAIIKNTQSIYEPGKRSGQWLKVKREDTVDVYVIGATKSEAIPFGALMLERNGQYFGKVGTGFSDQDRKNILNILKENIGPLHIPVPPELESEILITTKPLLAEIKVNEIIKGTSPRAPVWVRFRWD